MPGQEYTFSTVEIIRDELLRRSGDSTDSGMEFLSEESIIFQMDRTQRMVVDAPYSKIIIAKDLVISPNMKGWSFMEDERKVTPVVKTTLGADYTAGGGTLTLASAANFPTGEGGFMIENSDNAWEIGKYTVSDLSTLLTGVSDVDSSWDSGDRVYRLYTLPDDFAKVKELKINDSQPYTEVRDRPVGAEYSTVKGLLWLPTDIGTTSFTYTYTMKVTLLDDIEDTLKTPLEFDEFYINYLLARFFLLNGNPQKDIDAARLEAYNQLCMRMGYDVKSANRRINLLRKPPQTPHYAINPDPDFELS